MSSAVVLHGRFRAGLHFLTCATRRSYDMADRSCPHCMHVHWAASMLWQPDPSTICPIAITPHEEQVGLSIPQHMGLRATAAAIPG